jgi:hypothetical protein
MMELAERARQLDKGLKFILIFFNNILILHNFESLVMLKTVR